MQNSERQRFDEAWKSAFDGAEMTPPDSVWNTIEVGLAGDESDVMKRRVIYYQRLAAAMVVLAFGFGIYAFLGGSSGENTLSNVSSNGIPDESQPNVVASADLPKAGQAKGTTSVSGKPPNVDSENASRIEDHGPVRINDRDDSHLAATVAPPPDRSKELVPGDSLAEALEGTEKMSAQPLTSRQGEVVTSKVGDPADTAAGAETLLTAEQINGQAEVAAEAEKKEAEGFWVGMGAAAGNYDPAGGISAGMANADATSSQFNNAANLGGTRTTRSNRRSGNAYTFGLSAGKHLGKRMILQSGLNYVHQQVEYLSNVTVQSSSNTSKAAVAGFYQAETMDGVSITNDYPVNSNIEMVSVPVQLGYLIVDRRLGWQMNGGISTDLFVRNTLVDKSGGVSRFSQGAGQDSPYRTITWSGLLNTEVSYKLGDHYRLSLVPGIRYSFQPALKDNSGGTPVILDVGFRFKYILR